MWRRRTRIVAVLISAAVFLMGGRTVSAQKNDGRLETAVHQLADEVAEYLKGRAKVNQVDLESFGPADPRTASNFGAEIKRLLAEELKSRDIIARYDFERKPQKEAARFSCLGEYAYFPESGKVVIDVTLKEGKFERATCSKELHDVSDVAALMGGTGVLSIDARNRRESLVSLIKEPQPVIQASASASETKGRVAAAERADYAMEIWRLKADRVGKRNPADDDYELVPISEAGDGLLFANLDQDNIYAIRLINNTDQLAAATVTIDGLNMFTFSEALNYRQLGKVLVPPASERPDGVLYKGWHHTNAHSYAFQVCDVGESAVAELGGAGPAIEDEVGVITVRFAAAADLSKGETLPADEPKSASLATKRGPLVGQTYQEKDVHIGLDREVISVRYSHPLP